MATNPVPSELANGWQTTLGRWARPTGHDKLIGLAAKHEQFAWLATRYRDAARSNPEDPIAQQRLQKIQRAATILTLSKTPAGDEKVRNPFKAVAILLLGAAVACFLAFQLTEQQVSKSHAPKPTAAKNVSKR